MPGFIIFSQILILDLLHAWNEKWNFEVTEIHHTEICIKMVSQQKTPTTIPFNPTIENQNQFWIFPTKCKLSLNSHSCAIVNLGPFTFEPVIQEP